VDNLKVAILTLGFHPRPLEHVITTQKPDACHVITSPEGLHYVASEHGYKKTNAQVLRDATKRARCKLKIHFCDPFDPDSIGDAVGTVLARLKPRDKVIINYSGGTQAMSLVLGSIAVVLSEFVPVKLLYSTRLPRGKEKIFDHTKGLNNLFRKLHEIVPELTRQETKGRRR
jgi:hypothetical protein